MVKTLIEIERDIDSLSLVDKEALLQKLMNELEPIDSEIEEAWVAESKKRVQAMRAGTLELIDGEEAFNQAIQALNEKV